MGRERSASPLERSVSGSPVTFRPLVDHAFHPGAIGWQRRVKRLQRAASGTPRLRSRFEQRAVRMASSRGDYPSRPDTAAKGLTRVFGFAGLTAYPPRRSR